MTYLEALDRATRIWGKVKLQNARGWGRWHRTDPGEDQWYVDTPDGNSHSLDCNGHVTCHEACDRLESAAYPPPPIEIAG